MFFIYNFVANFNNNIFCIRNNKKKKCIYLLFWLLKLRNFQHFLILKNTVTNHFPEYFSAMFYELSRIGCSDENMEKALEARTLTTYTELISSYYPSNRTAIGNIINRYR
jgi:hypothetical protein